MASAASTPGKQILALDLPVSPQFSVVHEITAFQFIQVFIIVRT